MFINIQQPPFKAAVRESEIDTDLLYTDLPVPTHSGAAASEKEPNALQSGERLPGVAFRKERSP